MKGVTTIEEALDRFASVESLEGVTDTKTSFGVAASKHMTLERLPRVLILHLKRFSFDEKSQKISDHITFGVNLVLDPSLVSPNLQKTSQRKYKLSSGNDNRVDLLSVITHHGEKTSNGHYTCDIRQKNGNWMRFDDETVYRVSKEEVLDNNAYVLFYDLIGN